ncbi:MAG: trans-sulfuration enzyme family protein [Actinomycetota bacterium]
MHDELHPSTVAITAGRGDRRPAAPTNLPVTLSSTFHAGGDLIYGRYGNPNWSALEEVLGALEGGRSLVFSSGMGAISAVLERLPVGSTVVMPFDAYLGTRKFVYEAAEDGRLNYREADVADTAATLRDCEGADLLWLESPTNPLMSVADIATLAEGAHDLDGMVVVDNTFATPLLQRPLDLGADIVVHSTTKYLNGHSDSVGGAVVLARAEHAERIQFVQNSVGAILSPFDSWLVLRGLKTLPLRMRAHDDNGLKVSRFLEGHARVARVLYPGLPSHPQHDLARRQTSGSGGMISFYLKSDEAALRFFEPLRLCALAESLGGIETLICQPSTMTHASVPREERRKLGLTDSLVRISVGCEDVEDILADLEKGLAAAA